MRTRSMGKARGLVAFLSSSATEEQREAYPRFRQVILSLRGGASFTSSVDGLSTLKILSPRKQPPNLCSKPNTFQVHNLEHLFPVFLLKYMCRTH